MTGTKHKTAFQAARQAVGVKRPMTRKVSYQPSLLLGDAPSMSQLRSLKGCGLIRLLLCPDGKDNPHPDIGQSTHGNGVAFALSAFALVIRLRPGLSQALKGKLLQGIAQRLDTTQTSMSFGVHPTLKQDRRGTCQSLQAHGREIATTIIPNFSQHARSQACSSSRQGLEQFVVLMLKKKGARSPCHSPQSGASGVPTDPAGPATNGPWCEW